MRNGIKIYSALFIILFFQLSLRAQISPGDLVEAHAHLEGMSNCTKCHTLGSKISNDKCLACHTEIKSRIDKKKGYHASSKVYKRTCIICHSDHHGRNYKIIRFETESFDHSNTGYRLEGKHATVKCQDCHQKSHVTDAVVKKKKFTYLGLGTECLTCHDDRHKGTLSSKCNSCHSFEAFKPAAKFDHSKSKFPLRGKHSEVKCNSCHPVKNIEGKDFQQFKGIKFNSCASCHKDVHNGQFGTKCSDCHTEQSFKSLKSSTKGFNHDITGFALQGKHTVVDCKSCHKVSFTASLNHDYCRDCHTDYHNGQFIVKKPESDCRDCHTPYGFDSTTFDLKEHNKAEFVLEGAHQKVKCESCHKKNDKWSFRQIGFKCNDCHVDIHKDHLNPKYYPDANCRTCHSPESWIEITFDHKVTNFPLTGKHAEQSCTKCHLEKNPSLKTSDDKISTKNEVESVLNNESLKMLNLPFTGLSSECMECHPDEHEGQFMLENKTDCGDCHTPDNWIMTVFNHDNARFKLDGKHRNIDCIKCHPVKQNGIKPYVLYKTGKFKCVDCHS